MKPIIYMIIFITSLSQNGLTNDSTKDSMKLKITIGKNTATAILFDNATSKDFVSLLPLTLELNDYANTEKVANLDKRLSIENSPDGFNPSIGDLTYYAPWGNIALFYQDFSYAKGLVCLGKITSGMEYLSVKGSINVLIELD